MISNNTSIPGIFPAIGIILCVAFVITIKFWLIYASAFLRPLVAKERESTLSLFIFLKLLNKKKKKNDGLDMSR